MSRHDQDKIMQIAAELGQLRSKGCEICNRRADLIDQLVMELVRLLDE